jgi:hypothetical protein
MFTNIYKLSPKMLFCEKLMSKFREGDYKEKRNILHKLGQTMTLKDGNIQVESKYPFYHFENVKKTVEKPSLGVELNRYL